MVEEFREGSQDPPNAALAGAQATGVSARKRKLPSGGGSGSGGGGGGGGKRWRANNDTDSPGWACYFLKWDPRQYSRCRARRFTRLSDITQHINRQHRQPSYCPICGTTFDGEQREEDRSEHIRLRTCQLQEFKHPGATSDQMDALRKTTEAEAPGATNAEERRRYGKYRILFGPTKHLPESPYNTDAGPGIGSEIFEATCDAIQSFYTQGHLQSVLQSISHHHSINMEPIVIQCFEAYKRFVANSSGLGPVGSRHFIPPAPPQGDAGQPPSPSICFPRQDDFAPDAAIFNVNSGPGGPAGFSATPVVPLQYASLFDGHGPHHAEQPALPNPYLHEFHDRPNQF